MNERFEDVLQDLIAELKKLQETDGIVDYHERLELIKTRVNLSEEYLVSAYLARLRIDTQMHICMFQPHSVRQCLLLGRLYERAHPKNTSGSNWLNGKNNINLNQNKGLNQYKKEVDYKTGGQMVNTTTKYNNMAPKKFLSNEEMSERRAKGLCYLCDEKYTPDHYCKNKKTQLFSMEIEGDDEDIFEDVIQDHEIMENIPQVSVNTVAGTSDYRTMKVKGMHKKRVVFVLLDS